MKEIECIPEHECLGEVENAEEMGSFRNGSREEGTGRMRASFQRESCRKAGRFNEC